MSINIRKEQVADISGIDTVTVSAFLDVPYSDHKEQFIVKALRQAGALTLSLVAEEGEDIVGHVAVSPVSVSDGSTGWYGLGPISVLPGEQGKGIGSMLMHAAINELKQLKAGGCVLLGDPAYYQRFGFEPREGLLLPDVPAEYFQALILAGELPQGIVTYHEAFSAQA